MKNSSIVIGIAFALAASLHALDASAQDDGGYEPSYVIEEIVTTARKREENLQDVPAAVSAFGAQQLQDSGVDNITEIANLTPNITMNETSGLQPGSIQIFIRGIGNDPAFDQGVGIYVDDVYLNRPTGGLLEVFDVERIEVLKGPQGNLYGRNTIGGAVKYISRIPSEETRASVEVKTGTDGLIKIRAGASGELAQDTLFGGLSVLSASEDGYQTNAFNGREHGTGEKTALRGTLYWTPSDTFSAKFVADYSMDDSDPVIPNRVAVELTGGAGLGAFNGLLTGANNFFPGTAFLQPGDELDISLPTDVDSVNTAHTVGGYNEFEIESTGLSLTLTWDMSDAWTVKSVSSLRILDNVPAFDFDGSDQLFINTLQTREQDDFSQELQFNFAGERSNAVLGLYYLDGNRDGTNFTQQTPRLRLLTAHDKRTTLDVRDLESFSVYGNIDWDINDQWQLSLGGRYTSDEQTLEQEATVTLTHYVAAFTNIPGLEQAPFVLMPGQEATFSALPFFAFFLPHFSGADGSFLSAGGQVDVETYSENKFGNADWSEFSPSLKLSYRPNDDVLLYAGLSSGFKAGGFNATGRATAATPFDPETVDTYSLGLKSTLAGGSVRLNAEFFYNDYTDKQLGTIALNPVTGSLDQVNDNVGEVTSAGAEVELTWLPPVEGLTFNLNLGLLDVEIDEFTEIQDDGMGGTVAVNVADNFELGYSPDFTGQARAQYDFNAGEGYMTLVAGVAYRSEMFTDSPVDITNPFFLNAESGSQTLWNASIAYRSANDRWRFALEGKNLGDERSLVNTFNVSNFITGGFLRGRTWGFSIGYDYY